MSSSLYQRLATDGQLLKVDMNDVEILDPRHDNMIAIGTKDLNGCSTIVIIDKGVILAHIAPMGPGHGKSSTLTGMEHFRAKAKAAVKLMQKNQELFDKSTTTWGILARIGTETPLDHYASWLRQLFEHLKLPMQQAYYDVDPKDEGERELPTGSIIVLRQGDKRRLFVEDREQTPNPQRSQTDVKETWVVAGPSTTRTVGISASRKVDNVVNHPSIHASKAPEATTDPATQWMYQGGTYHRIQGQAVLEKRSTPPQNQQFFNRELGLYMIWDGTNRWAHREGQWARV